jgi:hypothetical protein
MPLVVKIDSRFRLLYSGKYVGLYEPITSIGQKRNEQLTTDQ